MTTTIDSISPDRVIELISPIAYVAEPGPFLRIIQPGFDMSQIKYDQRTESNIATLQPDFSERVRKWLTEARSQGLNPLIHFGARTVEEQRELHDKFVNHQGPRAVAPEVSYHCYGRAFDWVNITDPDGGDKGLAFDNGEEFYRKGAEIAGQFEIRGIGSIDDDHLQDARFPTFADLPKTEFGNFPGMLA